MLRRIWDIFSMIAVAHLLAAVVLLAVLAGSGAFAGERMLRIRDAVMGRPAEVITVVETADDDGQADAANSGQIIRRQQDQSQISQLRIDQQLRELKALQTQLEVARAAIETQVAEFERAKRQWQADRKAEAELLASDGFSRSVAFYEAMDPDGVKDMLMTAGDDEAVRILAAMEERKAAKVIKAFTSEVERTRLKALLARLAQPTAQLAESAD